MRSFEFGSEPGIVLAFWFFLAFSALLGGIVYGFARRRWRRRAAGAAGFVAGAALFAVVHLSMLSGFTALQLDGAAVRLRYAVPPRTRAVDLDAIASVRAEPAFKGLWRLVVVETDGTTHESVVADGPSVDASRRALARYTGESEARASG